MASYSYDPLGRRTSKTASEGRTDYLYAGENAVTETFSPKNGGTPAETSNLFGDGPDELLAYSSDVSAISPAEAGERLFCALRVAPYGNDFARYGWNALVLRCAGLETLAGTVERKAFSVLSDRLGSPVALIGHDGTAALEYAYSAFGEAYSRSGTGNFVPLRETGPLLGNSRLFAGREYDAETGLYYNRARTYSPELGRFLQRDPVGQADQVNPYAYVANDPLGYTDPTGREKAIILVGEGKYSDNEFEETIGYFFRKYRLQGIKKENILISRDITSSAAFNDALRPHIGNIESVVYISHGDVDRLGVKNRKGIHLSDVAQIEPINHESCTTATITLVSCHTGQGDGPIAQSLSNATGVDVVAPTGYVLRNDPPTADLPIGEQIVGSGIYSLNSNFADRGEPLVPFGSWRDFYPIMQ